MPHELERAFPGLKGTDYRVTSEATPAYNCAAWAVSETNCCWDPELLPGNYWPTGIPRELSISSFAQAFEKSGYSICGGSELERGFEKLAIYVDREGDPTHVARQLKSGRWTSKLGPSEDIEHGTFAALEGAIYGTAKMFLRRSVAFDL
jgi:hypothetical protein